MRWFRHEVSIRFIGDPDVIKNYTMTEENRTPTSTTVASVALKLPQFWPEQPTIWFAQTEAQFAIKNITVELTKFYHVVTALDGPTAQRVTDLLETPPRESPYTTLKDRLKCAHADPANPIMPAQPPRRGRPPAVRQPRHAIAEPVRPIVPVQPRRRGRPPRVQQTPHAIAEPVQPIVPVQLRRRGRPPSVRQPPDENE